MKKVNRTLRIFIVILIIFSLNSMPIFASEQKTHNAFDKYLDSKSDNNTLTKTTQDNLDSDEYIQLLLDEGINFEVKDVYYKKADLKTLNSVNKKDIIELSGEKYVITNEIVTINSLPEVSIQSQGDTRVRQVIEGSTQQIDSLSDDIEQFLQGSIMVLIGYSHPVMGFVTSLAGLFPYPQEEYGMVNAEVTNQYYYTNVWHEVYDLVGFIPMVITESRRTNVKYEQNIINKYTGASHTEYKWYQGVYYEYSMYYGQLTRNLEEASNMYNAGLRNPEVYRYDTGRVIDNTSILP